MSAKEKLDLAMNMLPTRESTVAGYRMVKQAVKTKGFPVLLGGVLVGYFARNLIDDARDWAFDALQRHGGYDDED